MGMPFFRFIFLFLFSLSNCHHISSWIDKHESGFESYVTSVPIGTPFTDYKLYISFKHSKIFLWTNIARKSVSFSEELGGTDYISISGKFYRVPVSVNYTTELDFKDAGCKDCLGVLGLAPGSALSLLFPEISVSRSTLTLGELGAEIGWNSRETLAAIPCSDKSGLCHTIGEIELDSRVFPYENIVFDPVIQDIVLRSDVYDAYTRGKNIYSDDISKWDHLKFNIGSIVDLDSIEYNNYAKEKIESSYGLSEDKYTDSFSFSISPEHLIQTTEDGGKRMLLKRSETDETRLGTEVMKHMIFHKIYAGNMILVQLYETNDHISTTNLILFLILIFLLARWMITHISMFYNDSLHAKRTILEEFYEFLGMVLSLTAFFLPSTFSLMETHQGLYIGTGILVFFAFAWNAITWGVDIANRIRTKKIEVFGSKFEVNSARVFSHEVLLLTGMWILLLERRVEGVADALVLIVNFLLVFDMSYHTIVMGHYIYFFFFGEKTKPRGMGMFFSFFVMSVIVLAYQSIIAVNFFARPLFVKNYETYVEIIVPGLVFFYMFIVTAANYLVYLFVEHAREKIKEMALL